MRHLSTERSFGTVVGWTIAGALVPGIGLIAARRRWAGGVVLGVWSCLLVTGLVLFFPYDRNTLIQFAADTERVAWLGRILFVLGLGWVGVIVWTYRELRPVAIPPSTRMGGAALVMALSIVVLLPLAWSARFATVSADAMGSIFRPDSEIRSETRPGHDTSADPWGGASHVNVLLLGSDARDNGLGVRTDTVIVASIDTRDGSTALFSLPRNLRKVPFPEGSKLAAAYPDGVFESRSPSDSMLNALYRNVPQEHPGLLDSDDPGADALKMGVGTALGLDIDYYVMVDFKGFEALIDALGGVVVNINYRVPIGGSDSAGIQPSGYLEPGPDQRLGGRDALWFARGRFGLTDYDRMDRQRCTIKAVIEQASPMKMLEKYESIARTSKQYVKTDIPRGMLPAFAKLSTKVKDAELRSVVFDRTKIDSGDPDYDLIRSEVRRALDPPAPKPKPKPKPSSGGPKGEKKEKSLEESCGYHPTTR